HHVAAGLGGHEDGLVLTDLAGGHRGLDDLAVGLVDAQDDVGGGLLGAVRVLDRPPQRDGVADLEHQSSASALLAARRPLLRVAGTFFTGTSSGTSRRRAWPGYRAAASRSVSFMRVVRAPTVTSYWCSSPMSGLLSSGISTRMTS